MMTIKKIIINILHWLLAFIISFLIINALLFPYHRLPGWIDRTNSATSAIWNPGSTIIMGTEGYGINKVDSKGYINPDKPLADDYCLIVGSSMTQGKEVSSGNRYSDLLNQWLSDDNSTLSVYNLSQDGFFFPEIVHHFNCIVQEFPNTSTIVIHVVDLGFDPAKEDYMLNQENMIQI